ncbi:MAG: PAS domain S-box protein, partial [Melioribacteraceae bacterium]|nr:PAS domain S-box protein [Melioribacteraceae bacterium]
MWGMMSLDIYQTLIEDSSDAIVLISLNKSDIEMNQTFFNMFGYTKVELRSKQYTEMLLPTQMEVVLERIDLALKGTSSTYEAEAYHKNGHLFHMQVRFNPLFEEGEVVGVICVARKMKELGNDSGALNQTTELLSDMFHSTADAIKIIDLNGHVIDVNPAFERMYGWSLDEIKGEFLPTIPKNRFSEANKIMGQIKAGEHLIQYETVCVNKNEELLDVSLTLSPIHNKQGQIIAISGITRDISKGKNLERLLKMSEERYRELVELSPTGIVIHRNGKILYTNKAAQILFAEKNAIGNSIYDYIHPRFQEVTEQRLSRIAKGLPIEFMDLKLVRKDGEHIYANIGTMKIPYDDEIAYLAMFHDVTEYKKMKKDLQESRNSYSELLKMSPLPIYVQCDGVIKYMNEAGAKALGYSHPNQLIGQSILEYYHPASRQKVENRMKRAFLQGFDEDDRFEHQMIRANGSVFTTEVSATVTKFFGAPAIQVIFRDITDRKQAEEALRASEENYRLMADNMTDLVSIIDESGLMRYTSPSHAVVLGHSPEFYLGKSAFDVV